jgi:hypothetical protein
MLLHPDAGDVIRGTAACGVAPIPWTVYRLDFKRLPVLRRERGSAWGNQRVGANPKISPIHEARAWRWLFSQGERESGRAGVLDSTSSTLAAFNAAKTVRSASAAANR